ncbi:MAG: virulence RhuM family protein [Alphaproteobacteria bacterium]|nr:virulence RhuM family protein [Alphaproteobacteria bacterium]
MKKIPDNQLIMFQAPDGGVALEVLYEDNNVWLSQKKIAELYDTTPQNIIMHLKNIYTAGELVEQATCKESLQVQNEGSRQVARNIKLYSLEAILAVGYRVNSPRGTQFRQWATEILHNYVYKGFAIDSDRFKYGSKFSTRFFDELLEEIRDIRVSERMAYQKITDIYATSIDYSKDVEITKTFFATVQNKLHFAITGHTAAEIITARVDSAKPHMGLTTWKRAPKGKIMLSDTVVAKNYLSKEEISHLNRIVSMYIDYAELQAIRHIPMKMADWVDKLNAFLKFSEYDILNNAGKVSHAVAEALATKEYEKFRKIQDANYVSDFDREIEQLEKKLEGSKK